jgi:FMN phosphatase YigB (HAD superfamily)
MRKISYVIVDIDGTIADVRHRLHHIKGPGRKNWKAFFEGMDRDEPIREMLEHVRELAKEHRILIVTGRPDTYRSRTERWLKEHEVPFERLYMRRQGDHRPDYEAKAAVLDEVSPREIVLAIDDRPPVCAMWERHGIKCLHVESDEENQSVNRLYEQKPGGKPPLKRSTRRTL